MGIDSDLIRGHIDTIILKILFSGDKYGYEICKEVEERSNGTYELKQPTLYSCLKRLEDKGFISSYWEDSDIGGKRHYYKLTDSGKEEYNKNQQEWIKSRSIIDDLISDGVKKEESNIIAEENAPEIISEPASFDEDTQSSTPLNIDDEMSKYSDDNNETYEELTLSDEDNGESIESPIQEIENNADETQEDLFTTESEDEDYENYDIMSMLGHFDTKDEDTIQENLDELESAQNILSSFDKKYSFEEDDNFNQPIDENTDENYETLDNVTQSTFVNDVQEESDEPAFNFNDYLNTEDTYFESEEAKSPIKNYIAPNIVIDGIDEDSTEDQPNEISDLNIIENEPEEEKPDFSTITPSYIRFDDEGVGHEINNNSSDIYVDDSNINYDEIYINPEEENDNNDAAETETNSTYMFDNFSNDETNESDNINTYESYSLDDTFDDNQNELQTTNFVNIAASTENTSFNTTTTPSYDSFTPKYTDEEYKQMLNQLDNIKDNTSSVEDRKIQMFNADTFNKNTNKDYADLKNSLSEEGFTVRPHLHLVKESKETKNYVQSNKIKMIQSWITFGFITCFLALTYLILENSASIFNFDIKYFLIGMGITLLIPAIYTVIYIFNPHKKHIARFIPRASYIISMLLSVQLLILVYCVNLQLGFYSLTQEHYNHLLWIVPSIISLYPIIQTFIYHALYNSKRFHI